MYCQVISAAICGLQARKVMVEADVRPGMPMFSLIGYLSGEVKEAEDRVRTALKNSGIELPLAKITVNLAPADLRKEGSCFDLPIAMAVLAASGMIDPEKLEGILFAGELGLDGRLEPVRGVIEMVSRAESFGCSTCIIPYANLTEGSVLQKGNVLGAGSIREVIDFFAEGIELRKGEQDQEHIRPQQKARYDRDFSMIKGQETLKRAAEVAVAGAHNLLIIGPPGSGKTLTAQCIATILPETSTEEAIEITRIHSIAGTLPPDTGLMTHRPFRAPHHTITPSGLAGGGRNPRPGEISLAHRGILFADEIPEFRQDTLEILRQPLEDKKITISRLFGNFTFPADFQLIASANPCKCGYYPDRKRCRCTPYEIKRYLNHLSQPLLDRIDMCVEAGEVSFEEMTGTAHSGGESSAVIRKRVEDVRRIQKDRFRNDGCMTNAGMRTEEIEKYCVLGEEERNLMEKVFHKLQLTGRGYYRLLKVSRTLADMDGKERICCDHIAEAVSYRMIDQKYWGSL